MPLIGKHDTGDPGLIGFVVIWSELGDASAGIGEDDRASQEETLTLSRVCCCWSLN